MQFNRNKIKPVNCLVAAFILCIVIYLNSSNDIKHTKVTHSSGRKKLSVQTTTSAMEPALDTKYILLWTNPNNFPFVYFGNGHTVFKDKKCRYQNCYVTSDRGYLDAYTDFEVIAFNGPQLGEVIGNDDLPKMRSAHQKYVYANIEAAHYYPICSETWNRFFNWTWTYKLNSDAIWGYILIKNASDHVIGPSVNVDWMNESEMAPVGDDVKAKLANKTTAAAWFVSNCLTRSAREKYVVTLQNYISSYNLKIDVYGDCGDFQCPKNIMHRCLAELQRRYYFYLAFENAISEDYVTEKILHALNHYTVPIVYGGANYSRYMPPGSYLDALELGPQLLARKIYEIIHNPELYYSFFRWRKYYSYHFRHESPETDDYCRFCAMINDNKLMSKLSTYNNFSAWWNPSYVCGARNNINDSFQRIIG